MRLGAPVALNMEAAIRETEMKYRDTDYGQEQPPRLRLSRTDT